MAECSVPSPIGLGCALGGLCLVVTLAAAPSRAASPVPMSAFAANVGARTASSDPAVGTTLYVVPEGRMLLVTDILIANHSHEVGPLFLADSHGIRCSVALLQRTLVNNLPPPSGFMTLSNVHTTFATGIPFGPGEPVIATLADGTRGVDVTITGRLAPAARLSGAVRLPGGAREGREPAPAEAGAASQEPRSPPTH